MTRLLTVSLFSCFLIACATGQSPTKTMDSGDENTLPYHEIPAYPDKVTAGTSTGRILDGLGYRYYWATHNLTELNLDYDPGNEGQKPRDVLHHLYGLSLMICQTAKGEPNVRPLPENNWTFAEERAATLHNIKKAADIFKESSDAEISKMDIVFKRGDRESSLPVWHLFNGPIDDAIYHVGQIVSFRRSAGNPMNPFVNVMMGKTRE